MTKRLLLGVEMHFRGCYSLASFRFLFGSCTLYKRKLRRLYLLFSQSVSFSLLFFKAFVTWNGKEVGEREVRKRTEWIEWIGKGQKEKEVIGWKSMDIKYFGASDVRVLFHSTIFPPFSVFHPSQALIFKRKLKMGVSERE